MASLLTHAVVALTAAELMRRAERSGAPPSPAPRPSHARLVALSLVCSLAPDADVAGLVVGIPYGALLGHRGLSHSLLFAALFGFAVARVGFPAVRGRWRARLATYFALVTASHALLDALTDGGLGVALFSPFDTTRHFLPWRPLRVSPIGPRHFFGPRGVAVLASELRVVWAPCLVAVVAVRLARRRA